MLKVTVDIFSGRPNPSWLVEDLRAQDFLVSVADRPSVVANADDEPPNLGYRGLVLESTGENFGLVSSLPDRFRLAAPGSANPHGFDLARGLLEPLLSTPEDDGDGWVSLVGADDTPLSDLILGELAAAAEGGGTQDSLSFPESEDDERLALADEEGIVGTTACGYEGYVFDGAFWNTSPHRASNNCYNFATAKRTGTFAQPGRASGRPLSPEGCATRQNGAVGDGAYRHPNCAPATGRPRQLVALVVWPGNDYHWYRRHPDGIWGHKPGSTAARRYDNVGAAIRNPYSCSRTPYTTWCGYFYAPTTMRVR